MAVTVRCPICGKNVSLDDPNSPFCSDRCRIIDLSNWATEKYVISDPASPSDFGNEDPEELEKGSSH
jgi:uncharacterized protein